MKGRALTKFDRTMTGRHVFIVPISISFSPFRYPSSGHREPWLHAPRSPLFIPLLYTLKLTNILQLSFSFSLIPFHAFLPTQPFHGMNRPSVDPGPIRRWECFILFWLYLVSLFFCPNHDVNSSCRSSALVIQKRNEEPKEKSALAGFPRRYPYFFVYLVVVLA